MKFVDEFRDPEKAKILIKDINSLIEKIDIFSVHCGQVSEYISAVASHHSFLLKKIDIGR